MTQSRGQQQKLPNQVYTSSTETLRLTAVTAYFINKQLLLNYTMTKHLPHYTLFEFFVQNYPLRSFLHANK